MPNVDPGFVVLGLVGGLLPDVLRLIKTRHLPAGNAGFWLGLLFQVLVGGFATWILVAGSAKEAVAYGFAAPELITKLVSEGEGARRGEFSLRTWWAN